METTGPAWACEQHLHLYRNGQDLIELLDRELLHRPATRGEPEYRAWLATRLPILARATPMYVSEEIDRAFAHSLHAFPLTTLVATCHLDLPLTIWIDRRWLVRELPDGQVEHSGYLVWRPTPDHVAATLILNDLFTARDDVKFKDRPQRMLYHGETLIWREGDPVTRLVPLDGDGTPFESFPLDALNNEPLATTEGDLVRAGLYFHLLSTWVATKLARPERVPIERHARKRLAHDAPDLAPFLFHVVTLRALEGSPTAPTDAAARERHCRFFVRGHQRHLASGRVVPVRPHVKGPKDKPLKPPTRSIFSVTR